MMDEFMYHKIVAGWTGIVICVIALVMALLIYLEGSASDDKDNSGNFVPCTFIGITGLILVLTCFPAVVKYYDDKNKPKNIEAKN